MQNNQLHTKSHVEVEDNSIDNRKICSMVSSMVFEVSNVLSSVDRKLELGRSLKSQVAPTKSIPTTSGTRQIEYIIFYTFGEPSILAGATHLESKPIKT